MCDTETQNVEEHLATTEQLVNKTNPKKKKTKTKTHQKWQQESFNKVVKVVREYTSRVRSIRGPNVGPFGADFGEKEVHVVGRNRRVCV